MLQTYEGGDFIAKPELVEIYALSCVGAWRWLVEQGATDTIATAPSQIVGSLYYRCHMAGWTGQSVDNALGGSGVGFIRPQERKFVDNGGERLVNHQAKKIVMNGNKAVGIIGTFPGGVFEVKAKAVIMATGGFGGNWEMLEEYQPNKLANYNPHDQEIKWANIKNYSTTNSISAATGEGLLMAKAIGASLYQMDQIQLLPGSNTGPGSNLADTIYVNELGKRIVNESGRRDELSLSYIAQVTRNSTSGSSWAVSGNPSGPFWGSAPTAYETVEDLGTAILTANGSYSASALSTFVTNFTAAVQNYNESFLNPQTVTDYAGKLLKNQELTAPWYYTPVARPYIHHTMGGIEINDNGEVLNTSGEVIPGLYAAGECVGGLHGANRIGGNAVGDIIVFGRLAGRNAAEYIGD
jgi:fumarate reductase flavoprotein subunit